MRKFAFAIAAATLMLFAGAFVTAEATTSIGTLNLPGVTKNFSPTLSPAAWQGRSAAVLSLPPAAGLLVRPLLALAL